MWWSRQESARVVATSVEEGGPARGGVKEIRGISCSVQYALDGDIVLRTVCTGRTSAGVGLRKRPENSSVVLCIVVKPERCVVHRAEDWRRRIDAS